MDYGRQLAADLITNTQGVDAWSDVAVSPAAEGHVALHRDRVIFPDIAEVEASDVPLVFRWQAEQTTGRTPSRSSGSATTRRRRAFAPSDAELKGLVAKRLCCSTSNNTESVGNGALSVYKLRIEYTLPGEITASHILKNGHAVSITLEGEKDYRGVD